MKSNILQWLLVALILPPLLMISGCSAIYHHYPFEEVRDVRYIKARLQQAVAKSNNLNISVAGKVVYQEQNLPIWLVTYSNAVHPRYKVLLTAGIHGNEPAGVEALISLIEELAQNDKLLPSVQIEVMPLLNPWAWMRDLRWNSDAIDVNRKFITIDTQESTIIKKVVEGQRYDITIDLHEDGRQDGFYSLTYDNANLNMVKELASTIEKQGIPLREFKGNKGFIHITRKEFEDLSLPTFALYCRLNVTEKAYLFETPFHRSFEDRVALHKTAILYLLEALPQCPR